METLLAPLHEYEEYNELKIALKNNNKPINVIGGVDSSKCHLIYGLSKDYRVKLIVTYNEIRAKEFMDSYRMYDRNIMYYPAKDLIFYSADIHGQAIVKERLKVIKALLEGEAVTIVTTIDAGMDFCMSIDDYKKNIISLENGQNIDLEDLKKQLVDLGYENTSQVEREGEFSVRGGILDIFSLTEDSPCRIEFWGDEIDTIRTIDVESQRSVEKLEKIFIYPATEIFVSEDKSAKALHQISLDLKKNVSVLKEQGKQEEAGKLKQNVEMFLDNYRAYQGMVNLESFVSYFVDKPISFFDYFDNEDTMVVIDEPARNIEKVGVVELEFADSMKGRLEKGYILPKQTDIVFKKSQILKKLEKCRLILFSTLETPLKEIKTQKKYYIHVQPTPSYNNSFTMLVKDIERLRKKKYKILIVSGSSTRGKRLCQDLVDYDIPAFFDLEMDNILKAGQVMVTKGSVGRGFEYPDLSFVVMTEGDIFGKVKKKKRKKIKHYEGSSIHSFSELNIGDYVVHENHGLGIYQGIEKIERDNVIKDYLKIAYAGGSNLYLPATSLEVLQKYARKDAENVPKLNKLNSPEWKKKKSKVKMEVEVIAKDLVELYAKRTAKKGYAFEKDTVWQNEFEELFPFEETEDQLKAIEDTKRDMESTKIMDRLICGDVGYGKTEIAIRAAFKAAVDGKQVAFLVPTTILAVQHYNTFSQRMKDFGINVELLCRLRSPKEQKKTIDGIRKGSVDIVIGTHRLLSKDISYKNLGLLIIDEEQRFGVKHKETLKKLKNDIDVLTLTATPIPRTLHMSLVGIRDMSVLEEAPVDRMPIQTFVMEKNDEIVREAIAREIARGGQVYYVNNRIGNMDIITNQIRKLVPQAEVTYAHGQMNERQLEDTMFRFVNGEVDVLVSTTIVETGLDIPNVNTIIIEDADRMGLSQLYQLRGRVGRSNRTAYAFMLYKRNKILKEEAEKRLSAIREFSDLGSGFKISMRDLEIRGAGSLLGQSQHGHIGMVGYDLYCKMLNEAIKRIKGEKDEEKEYDTSIEIKTDAYIPVDYIKNEKQKLDIYKRIAEIENEEEKNDMIDELIDRFGDPPKSVINLLEVARLKAGAREAFITEIASRGEKLKISIYPKAQYKIEKIPMLLNEMKGKLKFNNGENPFFVYESGTNALEDAKMLVEKIGNLKA